MTIKVGQQWRGDPRDLLLRPYDGSQGDLAALTRVRNETLRAITLPEDYAELDEDGMSRFYGRGDFSLEGNCWLLFHAGQPVGAAVIYPRALFDDRPPGNFDMYVVPSYWRHGLGARLLAHLEQAALARGQHTLETTVAREDEQSVGFLTGRGFRVVGQSAHLARNDLSDLPEFDVPEEYALRSLAELGEPPEMYRETSNRLGAYDPNYSLLRPEDMEATVQGERWDPAGVLFLFDPDRRIVGVIRASVDASNRGFMHEIRLEPGSRGRGLGRLMLNAALRYLAGQGVAHVELDTSGESTPAHNLALRADFAVTRHWLHFLKPLTP